MISRDLALSEHSISSLILELHTLYENHSEGLSLTQRLKADDIEIELEERMEWGREDRGKGGDRK